MKLSYLNSITCILLGFILLINQSESQKNVPNIPLSPEGNDYVVSNLDMPPQEFDIPNAKRFTEEGIMERNAGALPQSDYPGREYAEYNQEHLPVPGIDPPSNNEVYGIPEATENNRETSYPMDPAMSHDIPPLRQGSSQSQYYNVPPPSQGPSQPRDDNVPPRPYNPYPPYAYPRDILPPHPRRPAPDYSEYYAPPPFPEPRQRHSHHHSHHHHHGHNPRPYNQDYMTDPAIDRRFGPGNQPYRPDDQFHRHQ